MGLNIETERVLHWDNETEMMTQKWRVIARIIGNRGTVYQESSPFYCRECKDIPVITHIAKQEIYASLGYD